jgi:uncharacterized protein (DUF305 family)
MKHGVVWLAVALSAPPLSARAHDRTGMSMGGRPADKAFERSMATMMKNMAVKPTGNTDKDFVLMMTPHHQGAIDMAKVELRYGKDPELRRLARGIVAAQEKEIAEMKGWLARKGR